MSWPRSGVLLLLLIAGSGCSREHGAAERAAPAAPSNAGTPGAAPVRDVRVLLHETAFDLVSSPRGALLAWVAAAPSELHLARFDARGNPADEGAWQKASSAVADTARDLLVADTAAGVSAIWREGESGTASAHGLWLTAGAAQPLDLGQAWGEPSSGRGNLALVSRGAGALALVRGPRESCEDGSQDVCFGFRFYALSGAGAAPTGLGLRVPVPCDARAAQLVAPLPPAGPAQRWQYAVCTRSEQAPVLTVFSIEPERSYASARQVFAGCTPLGAAYFAGQPAFVAECQGSRQIARMGSADAPFDIQRLDVRGLVCGPHGARVRLGSAWLGLDQPLDHLELLLDASLTPPGARAVWTGSALLVARAQGKLVVDRYACEGSELRQLSSPLG
ncbi:MAG TPA: hypothetical protein VFS67_17155 [Polyangiaceae bacterium]|jgi:hypothetical protein|nr:hypothetical protein [Polyangiaceae bacterium]